MLLLVLLLSCNLHSVNAEEIFYTNLNGVQMTQNEYDNIVNIFSEQKASILTQQEFDNYKNQKIISSDVIYQKVITKNNHIISEDYITEEEFNKESNKNDSCDIMPLSGDYDYYETSYKRLSVNLIDHGSSYNLVSNLTWKKVPATKSFDVFAFRLKYFNFSIFGAQQAYFVGSNYSTIDYSTSSAGYRGLSNGAGISMNLKDGSNITSYEMTMSTTLKTTATSATKAIAYVSYQHAQKDVTRAQSMSYSLDISGLGNVIDFYDSTLTSIYDGMGGVEVETNL